MVSKEDAEKAGALLAERAEPRLEALLGEHGARHPSELPRDVAAEIFRRALVETAAATAPGASLDALSHGLRSFANPAFGRAFDRVRTLAASEANAFAVAAGADAAIVLAAFGLPVAPFDRKALRILAEPSNDIDEVMGRFSKCKSAFVGYSVCDLPFYMLVTDCLVTLMERAPVHPRLAAVELLIDRVGGLPRGSGARFQHSLALFAREPGDRIDTVILPDPRPDKGSILLQAGWTVDGQHFGAPNDGYMPVPMQFLQHAISDPETAMWIWRPVGRRAFVH
jgi:hypothetical protein